VLWWRSPTVRIPPRVLSEAFAVGFALAVGVFANGQQHSKAFVKDGFVTVAILNLLTFVFVCVSVANT
jgi:hypothetical protein